MIIMGPLVYTLLCRCLGDRTQIILLIYSSNLKLVYLKLKLRKLSMKS